MRVAIDAVIPGVDWSNPTWGVVRVNDCSLEFSVRSSAGLSFAIHVHGSGDPLGPIVALCKAHGWSAFDTTLGDFLSLEYPRSEGWQKFVAFRDRVVTQLNNSSAHLREAAPSNPPPQPTSGGNNEPDPENR